MNHLSPAEFVDAVERALPPPRAAHVDACGRCQAGLAEVRAALEAARAVDVPDPSPLYWSHLRANVRDRVAGERIAPAWQEAFSLRALVPIASALALVVAVVIAGRMTRPAPMPIAPDVAAVASPASVDAAAVEPEESAVWDVLTSAAAEMPIEDAHDAGMGVTSGAIDRAVQRLSPEELNELGHLLQTQLRGSGN
jgi:hypothetical protein